MIVVIGIMIKVSINSRKIKQEGDRSKRNVSSNNEDNLIITNIIIIILAEHTSCKY